MPYVSVQILTGASVAQKRALVSDITQSLVTRLGKKPEHIHVVIEEVAPDNWGYAGMLTTEYLRRREEAKVASPGRAKKKGRTKVRPASQ